MESFLYIAIIVLAIIAIYQYGMRFYESENKTFKSSNMPIYYILVTCAAPSNPQEAALRASLLRLNARLVAVDGLQLVIRRIEVLRKARLDEKQLDIEDVITDYGRRITVGHNIEVQLHEVTGSVHEVAGSTKFINYKSLKS